MAPLFLFLFYHLTLHSVDAMDLTMVSSTSGLDVVVGAIKKLDMVKIFPDDHNFFLRIAFIESKLGTETSTYRQKFYGGVWQVTELQYLKTKAVATYPALVDLHHKIYTQFGINWQTTTWSDLLKPFYSLLAAHLYFYTTPPSAISDLLEDQANLWYFWYTEIRYGSPSISEFISRIKSWEDSTNCSAQAQIIILMDESGSIGKSIYEKSLKYAAKFLKLFEHDISAKNVRVGFMTFSDQARVHFRLDDELTVNEMMEKVLKSGYESKGTFINLAILAAVKEFEKAHNSSRKDVNRVLVTFTDGESGKEDLVACQGSPNCGIVQAGKLGIKSFAVGIGRDVKRGELLEIAYGDAGHVKTLSNYDALLEFHHSLQRLICDLPQTPRYSVAMKDRLMKGEKRLYSYKVPKGQKLVVELELTQGDVVAFVSHWFTNPSRAIFDQVLGVGETEILSSPGGNKTIYIGVEGWGNWGDNGYLLKASTGASLAGHFAIL